LCGPSFPSATPRFPSHLQFIKFQIPADLLSAPRFDEPEAAGLSTQQRLDLVREHVAAIKAIIAAQEAAELELRRKQEEYERPIPPPVFQPTPEDDIDETCDEDDAEEEGGTVELMACERARPTFLSRLFGKVAGTSEVKADKGSSVKHKKQALPRRRAVMEDLKEEAATSMCDVLEDACDDAPAPPPPPPCEPVVSSASADVAAASEAPAATSHVAVRVAESDSSEAPASEDVAGSDARASAEDSESAAVRDLTQVPAELDRQYEELDVDAALHATIITPSGPWQKESWPSLLSKKRDSSELDGDDQSREKAAAFDLIDAVSW
jgi:hypothetical protein